MSAGALPLLARLGEAASFPRVVRHYETDSWGYMRRKLADCESPLRDYKSELFEAASARLLEDLQGSFLKPDALIDHKETFEKLLTAGDYADFSFHLDPGGDPEKRRASLKAMLDAARPKTVFDVERLSPERRGKPWQDLVSDISRRLELDKLRTMYDRGPKTEFRRAYVIRRLRRNLGEFMTVTRGEFGMREEVTLFVLTRVEAVIAALLRFLNA